MEMTRADKTIEIRRATLADEANILALVPRLLAFGPPPWRDPRQMGTTDLKVIGAALRADARAHTVLVAAKGSHEIAGFIHLRAARDYYTERETGHVADLVVAATHEGQGVGRRLLTAAQQWALERGYEWLTISVFEGNQRAAQLYEAIGFRRDILQMVMPLSEAADPKSDAP